MAKCILQRTLHWIFCFFFLFLCRPAFLPITLSHPPSTNSSPVRNVSGPSNPDLRLPWSCLGIPFVIHHVGARENTKRNSHSFPCPSGPPICSQSLLFPNWKTQHWGIFWYFKDATKQWMAPDIVAELPGQPCARRAAMPQEGWGHHKITQRLQLKAVGF